MRQGLLILGWVFVTLWAQGCIVIHTEEEVPCRPEAVGPESVTIREIDAVGKLAFENAKVDVLLTLVDNPSFTPTSKAFLLDRLDRLAFEHDKRQILDAVTR